ncbi:hypothetical protein [Bradyrhizobium sp. CCBAU 25338]|uniref:hypothetical protein n=1 Tax=Bradyrhizobium sp. CCBAU 25338 TaxID=1641877 RepID=UPI002304728C|nr:hypothetical protein [Bradyrhizobium sp. CCBAU 25338]MDA9528200.1 hypothetical protein [Bradyrhizobium sp. CCBAU 25338]
MLLSFDGAVFGRPPLSKVHARRSITSEIMRPQKMQKRDDALIALLPHPNAAKTTSPPSP